MILSNISRWHLHVERIIALIEKFGINWDDIINVFTVTKYNASANLHYLGTFLNNLSHSKHLRRYTKYFIKYVQIQSSQISSPS